MASSRNNTIFDAATAGIGLCALYYGVKWFIAGSTTLIAGQVVKKGLDAVTEPLAKELNDSGAKSDAALLKLPGKFVGSVTGALGVGALAGSGLLLFSAYSAKNSLQTGQPMGPGATLIGAGAATVAACSVYGSLSKPSSKPSSKPGHRRRPSEA